MDAGRPGIGYRRSCENSKRGRRSKIDKYSTAKSTQRPKRENNEANVMHFHTVYSYLNQQNFGIAGNRYRDLVPELP